MAFSSSRAETDTDLEVTSASRKKKKKTKDKDKEKEKVLNAFCLIIISRAASASGVTYLVTVVSVWLYASLLVGSNAKF